MRYISIFFLLLISLVASASHAEQYKFPIVEKGVLDLREWDFLAENSTLPLEGEWQFAWRKFVDPQHATDKSIFEAVSVPHNWRGANFDDEVSDGRGFGTYKLRIRLPENHPALALKLPGINYATAIYINGELIHEIGKPGKSSQSEIPYHIVDAVPLPAALVQTEVLDIVIHMSNHAHARGGMTASIQLGTAKVVMTSHTKYTMLIVAMVSGMLALMAYCLVIYCTRRTFPAPFYFAMLLLSIAAHMGASKGVFVEFFPFLSGLLLLRVEYLAVVMGAFMGYLFIASLYPQNFNKVVHKIIFSYTAVAVISLFTLGSYLYSSLLLFYEAGMMLTVLAMIVGLGLAAYRRQDDAVFLLLGLSVSFVFLAIGITTEHLSGETTWLMVYVALITNIVAQAITLGRQMTRSVQRAERLGVRLQEANEQLETRVSERTQSLNKALEEAEAANRIKSDFLATMSHEIRTPMNGVIGMTEAMLAGDLSVDQHENAQVIKQSANALMVILNDILDISKIEAGKIVLESRAFSPNDVINNTIALWQEPIAQKGLELQTETHGDLTGFLMGDQVRLGQVLSNLLSNACKFTENGRVKLKVSVNDTSSQKILEFRVEDTGTGINCDKIEEIFKPFSQADQTITRRFGGTGLGLSICVNLAKLMGGTLRCDHDYKNGACFIFTCTFDKTEAPEAIAEESVTQSFSESHRLSLLVAEDNEGNRKVFKAILGEAFFDLTFAHDGVEAVNKAEADKFDAILMDVHMPNMDGVEATKTIRISNGPNATTPIIAITANAMAGDREKYLSAGMDDFVPKPINPEYLIQAIRAA